MSKAASAGELNGREASAPRTVAAVRTSVLAAPEPQTSVGGEGRADFTVSEGQALRFFGTAASGPRHAKRGGSGIFGWQALFAGRCAGGHSGQDVKSMLTVVATGGRRFPKRWLQLLVNKVGVRIGMAFFGRS